MGGVREGGLLPQPGTLCVRRAALAAGPALGERPPPAFAAAARARTLGGGPRVPSAVVPASPVPAPAADVSTRDEPVRALYSFISPPLVPALEFPKAAYSVYSC